LIALALVYASLTLALWVVMHKPPDQFGQVMARMPTPLFIALPFKPLWLSVRAGRINVGDAAPDFSLASVDRKSQVRLSDDRGRPVVLVFGSYT
jgi:hypothetical protein